MAIRVWRNAFAHAARQEPRGQAALGNALVSRTHDLYASGQIREQITREVRDAVHQLEEASQALAAGTTSFDLAQKTLTSEQRKFELGAETNFFVLDAQTRLAQAELILLQTQVNYRIALAAGRPLDGRFASPTMCRSPSSLTSYAREAPGSAAVAVEV